MIAAFFDRYLRPAGGDAAPGWREALAAAYSDWRHERDLDAIYDALARLSERQLRMIGMSRETLDLDVERLAEAGRRTGPFPVEPAFGGLPHTAPEALAAPGLQVDLPRSRVAVGPLAAAT